MKCTNKKASIKKTEKKYGGSLTIMVVTAPKNYQKRFVKNE